MRNLLPLILILLLLPCPAAFSQTIPDGPYLGQVAPGSTPEVFAPGIISLDNRYEYVIAFSPDLRECVFGVTNNQWSVFTLLFTRMDDDSSWSQPVAAPFQGSGDGLLPAYTQDGDSIFFISMRPAYPPSNVWVSRRVDTLWADPVMVPPPVSTAADEFGLSVANDDKLYFTSNRSGGFGQHDIYFAVRTDSQYTTVQNLGPPVNTQYNEASPFIAPDGSYLVFESNRPGGYGQVDLYISFFEDSAWTAPRNLGPTINTSVIDDAPFVSPDGNYLFFNRRQAWVTSVQTDIYWVDAAVLFDTSSTEIEEHHISPTKIRLNQNVPNPFNPSTTIDYWLPNNSRVELSVYDLLGKKVATLVDGYKSVGQNSAKWNGKDDAGRSVSSGIYVYRMRAGKTVATRKMLLLR